MRSVYVSFYEAYPPVSGAASVTYCSAKYTPGERYIVQLGECEGYSVSPDGVDVTTINRSEDRIGKLMGLWSRVNQIVRRCADISPDVIVLEGASWAVYHLMLLRAIRRAGVVTKLWYHSHNVEYVLRRKRNGRIIAAVTGWAEKRLLRESDRAFAVSDVDRAQFRSLYGVETELWPNGVDVGRFDAVTDEQIERARTRYGIPDKAVLFMGLYAYPPNQHAVDFLDREVMPRVLEKVADAKLVILGGNVPFEREWLVNPGVVPFEALPAVIKACKVGAAPIFEGSGTRLKILEYVAAGLPVVSTAKGAEGLSLRDADSFLIREDGPGFAEALRIMLADPCARSNGEVHQTVRSKFAWSAIAHELWVMS